MLLLDPGTHDGPPTIWAVKSMDEFKGDHGAATLVAHNGEFWMHITLLRGLPQGWKALSNRSVADLMMVAAE